MNIHSMHGMRESSQEFTATGGLECLLCALFKKENLLTWV
jgi:hypothetical protein